MRTIFYIVGCLLLLGCQKEDALESKIDYVNLYEITDSPEDSVQHLRYELYKNYNVSVYFTDTVGKYFLKNGCPDYKQCRAAGGLPGQPRLTYPESVL